MTPLETHLMDVLQEVHSYLTKRVLNMTEFNRMCQIVASAIDTAKGGKYK